MSEENNQTPEIKDPKAVLDALERAKADAKKFREELEALQEGHAELVKAKNALDETVKSLQESDGTWKNKTKELLVKGHLGPNAERVMKFLDMNAITLGDDGEVAGLNEAVAKVKSDLPELFDPKKRVGGAADLFDKGDAPKAATGTEAQVQRIFRNR